MDSKQGGNNACVRLFFRKRSDSLYASCRSSLLVMMEMEHQKCSLFDAVFY